MEYMSQEGYDKIASELRELIKVRLPESIQAIAEARDKGDLSENFEYRAAKRENGRVLGRIRYLQNVLTYARVLPQEQLNAGTVQLLSKVTLLNTGTNKTMHYTIVSPHEASVREAKISIKSPIAQALVGKKKGDVVEVRVPVGVIRLKIVDISV